MARPSDGPPTTEKWWKRTDQIASLSLAAVLIVLAGMGFWGASFSFRVGEAAEKASALSRAFEDARFAVAGEESLERKYRLEPGPAVRRRYYEAGEALLNALRAARHLDTSLATGIDKLIVDHDDYLLSINRMFAAIDAGDTVLATSIDGSEVDPKFEALENAVFALADQQREVTQ